MSAIELAGINKSYSHDSQVIFDVNMQINQGEFIVIVGPSGCGKSTLLRMIAGLEEISSGQLKINDEVANHMPPQDRDIAFVFQNYALYPHLNVRENIAFSLELRKISKAERHKKAEEVAQMVRLTPYLDKKPGQLSGGQRQRVAMGRAIARDAHIFLMDEPLSNLDAELRNSMRAQIKTLHKKLGNTTVYVTHDQVEALTLADKIAVMKGGVLQQFASPEEIYDKPENVFVASFIGSPEMNILPFSFYDNQGYVLAEQVQPTNFDLDKSHHYLLGIRPDKLHLICLESSLENYDFRLKVKTNLIETTGSLRTVHCKANGHKVRLTVKRSHHIHENEHIEIGFNRADVLWFDAETQNRIDV